MISLVLNIIPDNNIMLFFFFFSFRGQGGEECKKEEKNTKKKQPIKYLFQKHGIWDSVLFGYSKEILGLFKAYLVFSSRLLTVGDCFFQHRLRFLEI